MCAIQGIRVRIAESQCVPHNAAIRGFVWAMKIARVFRGGKERNARLIVGVMGMGCAPKPIVLVCAMGGISGMGPGVSWSVGLVGGAMRPTNSSAVRSVCTGIARMECVCAGMASTEQYATPPSPPTT